LPCETALSNTLLLTFHNDVNTILSPARRRRRPNIRLTCKSGPKGLAWFLHNLLARTMPKDLTGRSGC